MKYVGKGRAWLARLEMFGFTMGKRFVTSETMYLRLDFANSKLDFYNVVKTNICLKKSQSNKCVSNTKTYVPLKISLDL